MADKKTPPSEIGVSGTSIAYGQITGEEFNFDLVGKRAVTMYDKMRRTDVTIQSSLSAMKMPIKQADYSVDAASTDDIDVEVAETVKACLFEVIDWPKFLNEALTYLEMGYSVFEMVFEPRDIAGKPRIALVKLGFRKQTTIYAWQMDGGLPGIKQMTPMGVTANIPLEKIVRFTNNQEGDNYEGVSILRSAIKNYTFKDTLEKIDMMGHERQSLGVVDIIHPDNATDKDKNEMKAAARDMRANAQSYIMRGKGWEVGFMDMKAKSMKDILPSIYYHDRQISKAMQQQFNEIGAGSTSGNRAVSEDQSRMFEMSVQAVADHIAKVLQDTVVKTIVDLNFTGRPYPTLNAGHISDENIPVLSEAFAKFVTAGVIHPQPQDENRVRNTLGFAELDEDELDALYNETDVPDTTDTTDAADAEDVKDPKAPAEPTKASVVDLARQMRASIESALYDTPVTAA